MKFVGKALQRIGQALAFAGGGMLALIFAIVLLNGTWPDFLKPIQSLFQMISEFSGNFAFVAEIAIFIGPGVLLWAAGEKILERDKNRNTTPSQTQR